jgi:hydroxymethylbilane synthase
MHLRIGTRTSPLALWQSRRIITLLQASWPTLTCELVLLSTAGDRTQAEGRPLPVIGGKGLFTEELESALRSGAIDLAVHALKDLPVADAGDVVIGAVVDRADVRDGLVARNRWTLATLPAGAVIGTSSLRREAQLRVQRPDLILRSIRGNVESRIAKVERGEYDATVLAMAGIVRLELLDKVTDILPLDVMLPAPGQGALAVQCRADDPAVRPLLAAIDHPAVRRATTAERAFLAALGGGCSAPVAALGQIDAAGEILLQGLISTTGGEQTIRVITRGVDALALGQAAAAEALAKGATALLMRTAPVAGTVISAPLTPRPADQPLLDRKILITRPRELGDVLAGLIVEQGGAAYLLPSIRVTQAADLSQLDTALSSLHEYDWIVFTSRMAADIVVTRLDVLKIRVGIQTIQIAAIGATTAARLIDRQLAPHVLPTTATAKETALALGNVQGKRVLLPRAAAADQSLPEWLAGQGAIVTAIPIYDTTAALIDEEALAAALPATLTAVDACLFASGTAVRSLVRAAVQLPRLMTLLTGAAIVCIGPSTAAAAEEAGLVVDKVAADPSNAGFLQALAELWAGEPPAKGVE